MLAAEPATTPPHLHHPRKPLQPRNTIINYSSTPKSNHHPTKPLPYLVPPIIDNKENLIIQSFDASLAEELSAVKLKLERLKLDKDNTDKLLHQRDRILDLHFTELLHRGDFQKELEIEVDRLYRLKQLQFASMRSSPIRSLREKETEKKSKDTQIKSTVVGEKSGESKELEKKNEESSSSSMSLAGSSSTSSKSTGTSKTEGLIPIPLKFSLLETHVDDHLS